MTRRLPDGTTTKSDTKYVDTWRSLAEAVSAAISTPYETWVHYAYDPDIGLRSNHGGSLDMPVFLARRIVELAKSAVILPLCDCGQPIPFGSGPCKCGIVWAMDYPKPTQCLGVEAENAEKTNG